MGVHKHIVNQHIQIEIKSSDSQQTMIKPKSSTTEAEAVPFQKQVIHHNVTNIRKMRVWKFEV